MHNGHLIHLSGLAGSDKKLWMLLNKYFLHTDT